MIKLILFIVVCIVFISGYIRYTERQVTFFPMKKVEFTPEFIRLPFEDVYLNTEDNVRINGWFIPSDNADYTILFLHGNAGNIAQRLEKLILFNKIQLNVFIIDYRGYGNSSGSPSERGFYRDAEAAYDYLLKQKKITPERILLYGESLGSAVCVHLASYKTVGGLITEAAFTRSRDMAKIVCPYMPSWLFSDSFNSLSKIDNVTAPTLIIHSKNDEIVPFKMAERLYEAASGPKYFAELAGGHNVAYMDSREKYIASIVTFVERLRKTRP